MYTIGQVATKMNMNISTLRYYDKEGLLINIKRDSSGNRIFDDNDINALTLINCLKNSGLKIKEIKYFMDLCKLGNESLNERLDFFNNQEKVIEKEIYELNKTLNLIKFKKWYYEESIKCKNEEKVRNMRIEDMPLDIRKLYEKSH